MKRGQTSDLQILRCIYPSSYTPSVLFLYTAQEIAVVSEVLRRDGAAMFSVCVRFFLQQVLIHKHVKVWDLCYVCESDHPPPPPSPTEHSVSAQC